MTSAFFFWGSRRSLSLNKLVLSWVFATLKSVARETFLLETKRELVEEQIEETEEMMNDIAAIERANKNYVSHERLEIERDLEGRKKEAEYIRKEIEVTV